MSRSTPDEDGKSGDNASNQSGNSDNGEQSKPEQQQIDNESQIKETNSETEPAVAPMLRRRRGKREKETLAIKAKKRKIRKRQQDDSNSSGVMAILPSVAVLVVLFFGFLAKSGFRGRSSVAGIDLGTTNSVVCVQQQDKQGVGTIDCVPDPYTKSPIIPSVVAFIDAHDRPVGASTKVPSLLNPHPTHVLVGAAAKERIDAHPHRTLFNAKRVMGHHVDDEAVKELKNEVEFQITASDDWEEQDNVRFRVKDYGGDGDRTTISIPPQQVGSYVVSHLMKITKDFLGHDNVKSAVIAVPAKFNQLQRQRTVQAFQNAGVNVGRILEEPTAAALAYGLHQKPGVEHVLVYDFGGGTLDISMLHIASNGGYCDVMGSDGDDRLGGADFDAAVAHLLEKRHGDVLDGHVKVIGEEHVEAFGEMCSKVTTSMPLCSRSSFHTLGEQLKIELSRQLQKIIDEGREQEQDNLVVHSSCLALPVDFETTSDDETICESLEPLSLSLTLPDYDAAVQPLYDRATLPVTRLLKDLTLTPDEVDEIVLVGGTTRLPQIRRLVRNVFVTERNPSPELNAHIDPDLTVAYGAASVTD